MCLLPPARNQAFDVVLVDTAGRMQDNAPLMTALAKLIAVNMPDLVLFVGEALVGNEAVDQLVRPLMYFYLLVRHIMHLEGLTDSDEEVSVIYRLHGKSFPGTLPILLLTADF